jgi:hypothetical protein
MAKKTSTVPPPTRVRPIPAKKVGVPEPVNTNGPKLRLWLACLFVLGLIVLGVVSFSARGWFKGLAAIVAPQATQPPVTMLNVGRAAPYAGLQFTVVNAQYSLAFPDDNIHLGQAVVRLNMRATNPTTGTIAVVYYDDARLLVSGTKPIMPSNVRLSVSPSPGATASGWIDFPVPANVQLSALKLQLGSSALGESLVTIPFSGKFDPSHYANRTTAPNFTIYYTFQGYTLTYHLVSVEVRYDYQGTQCKAGQQIYVLHFKVDNPNGADVSPGFGYDYVRLVLSNGNRAPLSNTIPYGFKANSQGTPGSVAYAAPSGLKTIVVGFLSQNGLPQSNYTVGL